MSNKSKEKGDRAETQVLHQLQQIEGLEAARVGLPLQAGQQVRGDLIADFAGRRMILEVKSRKGNSGFSQIVQWIQGVDALALKLEGDTKPLIVLPWDVFEDLLGGWIQQEARIKGLELSLKDSRNEHLQT